MVITRPSMFANEAKIHGLPIFNPVLKKHLVIGQRQKAPSFSAFYWSPHGCLVLHWSAFRNHEGSTFIGVVGWGDGTGQTSSAEAGVVGWCDGPG